MPDILPRCQEYGCLWCSRLERTEIERDQAIQTVEDLRVELRNVRDRLENLSDPIASLIVPR